jgi:polyisoprenoid-binding protein YceI
MKKQLLVFLLVFGLISTLNAQDKKITKTGHLWFFSHTSIEDIEAHSNQAVALLLPDKGSIAVEVPMMSFDFKKALMQEHFNENYVESSKFPKAKFMGSITNLKDINFSKEGTYNASVAGKLTIHNVTNDVKASGTVEVKKGKIALKSKFVVVPKDYNIIVESRFSNNVASTIDVNVDIVF